MKRYTNTIDNFGVDAHRMRVSGQVDLSTADAQELAYDGTVLLVMVGRMTTPTFTENKDGDVIRVDVMKPIEAHVVTSSKMRAKVMGDLNFEHDSQMVANYDSVPSATDDEDDSAIITLEDATRVAKSNPNVEAMLEAAVDLGLPVIDSGSLNEVLARAGEVVAEEALAEDVNVNDRDEIQDRSVRDFLQGLDEQGVVEPEVPAPIEAEVASPAPEPEPDDDEDDILALMSEEDDDGIAAFMDDDEEEGEAPPIIGRRIAINEGRKKDPLLDKFLGGKD